MSPVKERDQQGISAEFEQVAAVPGGDVEHGGEIVAHDVGDRFRTLLAPPGEPFGHGRKARDIGKHDGRVAKPAADLARLGVLHQLCDQVAG